MQGAELPTLAAAQYKQNWLQYAAPCASLCH